MGLEHLLVLEQDIVTDTIHAAIKGGVNYFDCLGQNVFSGESADYAEFSKLGNALEGYRDSVYITYIANSLRSPQDTERDFDNFLRLSRTDRADIFVIACCDKDVEYERVTGGGSLLEFARKLRSGGKVDYIGFSTHSTGVAHKVIESGAFDVLMYPVNPAFDVVADEEKYISKDLGKLWDAAYDYSANSENILGLNRKSVFDACERAGLGLVAMKPFAAGWLFREDINTCGFTPVNLISYALAQNGVSTVIPGCTSPREIEDILKYCSCGDAERDFSAAVAQSRWNVAGNCLYCNHCRPCTTGIDIAAVNRLLDGAKNGNTDELRKRYGLLETNAAACVKCGECEKRCPFNVKIIEKMERAAGLFG